MVENNADAAEQEEELIQHERMIVSKQIPHLTHIGCSGGNEVGKL